MIIGIDLGTTFSVVATVKDNGLAEVLTNREGERTTPSVVMFEDGAVVVGEQAKENSIVDPYNVCQFVKRQMGKKAFSFDVSADEKYSAEEISAMILKRLKEDAESATGEEVTGAVITVPAYFDDAQRKATQDAGEIAGLNVLGIINEPTAAAIAYCHGQDDYEGNVMVYDLGGGTFDITIMKLSDKLGEVETLSTTGNKNLGGFDFDNTIISKVISEFSKEHGINLEDDDTASQDLRIKAENTKKALSNRPKASISVFSQGCKTQVEITREEFEDMIKGYIESTKAGMEIALDDAGLEWRDISKVLLVGGSTRIPAIQNMIKDLTGIDPSHELNPDEAVAIGAAFYADLLNGEKKGEEVKASKKIKITDVNSHSLGIETKDDSNVKHNTIIIKRNTPLPAHGENSNLSSVVDYQENLLIKVLEGEDDDPSYDTIIGNATFDIPKRLKKDTHFKVIMNYDENGLIHVFIKDISENKEVDLGEIHIEREANLSNEEVAEKKALIGGIDID